MPQYIWGADRLKWRRWRRFICRLNGHEWDFTRHSDLTQFCRRCGAFRELEDTNDVDAIVPVKEGR